MSSIRLLTAVALAVQLGFAQRPAAPISIATQPFSVEAMLELRRISEHQISPDGKLVAFTVETVNLADNSKPRQIYVMPLAGGEARLITSAGTANFRPRWMPDSKRIAFVSNRGGAQQLWIMDADGSNSRQVTRLATEADGVLVTPDGNTLIFTSEVYPDCFDEACNERKLNADKASKVKVRTYTSLLYRHWDTWRGPRRKHIFAVKTDGTLLRDLTPGPNEAPAYNFSGPDGIAVSPDSKEICFEMNTDANPAASTNTDLFVTPIGDGITPGLGQQPEPRRVSVNNAADASPSYSPDGRYIAFRAQARPGFESDRWRLMVLDRTNGRSTGLTENLDRWVQSLTWSPDSKRIFFTMEDRGRTSVQMVAVTGGATRPIINGPSTVSDVQFTPDGKTMLYAESSASKPIELYRTESGGTPVPLTHLNDALLNRHSLGKLEDFYVDTDDRSRVQSFLLKPAGFDESKKYPILFLIHGGPQNSWGEDWSYRWNPQVFASAGFVVVMPNPRGSTGYGQRFIDEVSGDWGGKPYTDIVATATYIERQAWADPNRMAAAGASYGGYMVDWMMGHTSRFRAYVSHAGVFDLKSMALETEEQWFPIWEFGGLPSEAKETYEKWSPSNFIPQFRTPTLVVAGEQDFRVPYGQGLQLFSALQSRNVPSKLLVFPDEGHWILKPQNSALWYHNVIDWLTEWTRPAQ